MHFKKILPWLIAITLITSAVIIIGGEDILTALLKAVPGIMVLLIALQFLTLSATAGQWQYLLKKANCRLSLGHVLAVNLAGNYIESITPSVKLGGEAAKVYLFKRYSSLGYEALTGILLALKYFSLLPFVILSALSVTAAILYFDFPAISLYAFGFLVAFFMAIAALYFKKDIQGRVFKGRAETGEKHTGTGEERINSSITRLPVKLVQAVSRIPAFVNRASSNSRNLTTFSEGTALIAVSALIWLLYPLKVFLVTGMLDLSIGLPAVAIITFTAYLVSMVPLLPGGLGSYEGTMVLMFSFVGIAPAEGLAVALISRLITYWIPLLWSAMGAFYLVIYKPPAETNSPTEASDNRTKDLAALIRS